MQDLKPDNPIDGSGSIPPRDELVKTAAKFLSSLNVVNSPSEQKIAFLRKKGLSDAEIDLAVKQSEVIVQSRSFESNNNYGKSIQPYIPPWPQRSKWSRYRDVVDTVALVAALAYAVYWFYKKYIAPILFGGKKKSLDTRLADLDKLIGESMTEIKTNVGKVKEDMENMAQRRNDNITRQMEELKNEVSSLKKLMLSRKQFPTTSVTGPLSIPAWQIAASEDKEVEEEGVGSGTNGSDSSLEMIKE